MRAAAGLIVVVLLLAAGCARRGGPFSGRVRAHNREATAAENEARMQQLGFSSHGIVIESADGEVLWEQADHRVNIEDARAALRRLLRE